MKVLILNSPDGVTQGDAARHLDVDLRTAAAYLMQLVDSGFAELKTADAAGCGRPFGRYYSNRERLSFLGLSITQSMHLDAILIDFRGKVLGEKSAATGGTPQHSCGFYCRS